MLNRYPSFLLLIISIFFFSCPALGAKRVALVIGNSKYKSAPLKNPVNDANDIAKTLKKLDFDVIKRTNADQRAMDEAMAKFYKKLQKAEVGFFYFAGHGLQIDNTNYLIPIRANVVNPSDVKYKSVPAGRIVGMMKDAGNKLNIVVLDACRNNPFRGYFRSESKGLAFMDAPDGTIVAYATSPGSVAMDGRGRNGIYTKHLLKNLKKSDLSVLQLFNRTGLDVRNETSGKQTPWLNSSPLESYHLAGGSIVTQEVPTPRTTQEGGSLKVTSTPAGAELYINGKRSGYTPAELTELKPGKITVKVAHDGYSPEKKKVQIRSGGRSTVSFILSRISSTGWLTVTTTPSDAKVRLLNIVPRYTRGMELNSGRYHIEVSSRGYKTEKRWIEIGTGEYLDLDIELEKKEQQVSGRSYTDPTTGMEFVWIPGGCFQMGSRSGDSDEKPVHEVCVDGFYMGKTEVTIDQFRKYLKAGGSEEGVDWSDEDCPIRRNSNYSLSGNKFSKSGSQPMIEISYQGAKEMAKFLNMRLPTEAEWEYAARSGGKNEKYAGSNSLDNVAWYSSNSNRTTHRVGTKSPNGLGLYDMSGNVWEWCSDWYGKNYYSSSPRMNPQGPSSGSYRVIRGGGWYNLPWYVRSAGRSGLEPDDAYDYLGFRLVLLQGNR